MTIIVIGVIVLVGYWAINNTIGKSCQVEQLSFQNLIESMFSKYDTFGSMNKDSLTAPCNYETLCFVSASKINDPTGVAKCKNVIINSSVIGKSQQDIFVVSGKITISIGYSPKVSVKDPENCTCINQRNKNFYLTFNGQGANTLVTESE
jgi:hypothetical protein